MSAALSLNNKLDSVFIIERPEIYIPEVLEEGLFDILQSGGELAKHFIYTYPLIGGSWIKKLFGPTCMHIIDVFTNLFAGEWSLALASVGDLFSHVYNALLAAGEAAWTFGGPLLAEYWYVVILIAVCLYAINRFRKWLATNKAKGLLNYKEGEKKLKELEKSLTDAKKKQRKLILKIKHELKLLPKNQKKEVVAAMKTVETVYVKKQLDFEKILDKKIKAAA